MISARFIIPVLALAAGVSSQCADGVNEGVNNCKVEPRLVSINCQSGESCTCSDFNSTQDALCTDFGFGDDLDSQVTFETLNGDTCEELCQQIWDGQSEDLKKCQYYKFEEVMTQSPVSVGRNIIHCLQRPSFLQDGGRNCYFMNSAQCEDQADEPIACEEPFCSSGQIDCGDPPPTPGPDATTCPVKMPELVSGNIHWSCIHGGNTVDPYGEKPHGLPVGTVCTSRHP